MTFTEAIREYENSRRLTEEQKERERAIVGLAQGLDIVEEGVLEVDDNAVISEGSDNGAYVMAWVWVDFHETPLDKETKAGNAAAPEDCKL